MGQVVANSSITVSATPDRTLGAIADYQTVRPRILPEQFRDYRVVSGGVGAGTIAEWTLHATSKRSRNVRADVQVVGNVITETDENSSMITTWTVIPEGSGATVALQTRWDGAGGIGGIFEGIFAPRGLQQIYNVLLTNLQRELA